MQNLQEKHGFGTTDRGLRFLRIRLYSRPQSKHLVESVQRVRVRLRDTHEAQLEAVEMRAAATAEIVFLDGELGNAVMNISRHTLIKTNGKRDADLYKALFPISPSEMLTPLADDSQNRAVNTLIDALRSTPDARDLLPLVDVLSAHQTALTEAIAARDALYLAEDKAASQYRRALDDARRFHNQMFHQLNILFPDQKALVESFFTSFSKSKKSKDQASTDDE